MTSPSSSPIVKSIFMRQIELKLTDRTLINSETAIINYRMAGFPPIRSPSPCYTPTPLTATTTPDRRPSVQQVAAPQRIRLKRRVFAPPVLAPLPPPSLPSPLPTVQVEVEAEAEPSMDESW